MFGYKDDDIAIIGMAGRFPEADDLKEFWANLIQGRESIRNFPESRTNELTEMAGFTPAIRFARFGYLEHSTKFEPEIFSLSQEECKLMDPQQRLLLELVEEAILDAGYNPESLFNQHVGVFVADNENRYTELAETNSPMIFVNSIGASNAGRISYTYNFHGPAMIVGTACSSSMVAVHYACQSLKLDEADLAVVGGVNIALLPTSEEEVAQFPIFSPDQQVRTFDKRANGTIAGEGGGVVLLKRLKRALKDGDSIHAVIKGSAINNDGKWSNGITAPSEKGQADVIIRAVKNASVDPKTISYVEAHGTGTSIGDPIEVAGLSSALRELGLPNQTVPVGSLKTNIGHLDSAAGIAGILKTVLALKYKQIPPSLNFSEPNPLIDFMNSPVYVNSRLAPWESEEVRRAGVTSLSFVGTNAHVVLEEAPEIVDQEAKEVLDHRNLITLSARTKMSLQEMIRRLAAELEEDPNRSLDKIAYTLNTGRRTFSHKFVTTAKTTFELKDALVSYLADHQKSQDDWDGLGVEKNDRYFQTPSKQNYVSAFIVPDLVDADFTGDEWVDEAIYQQFWQERSVSLSEDQLKDRKIQYLLHGLALAQVFQAYGIKPKAYVGFGLGEIIVDCIRGDLDFEKAVTKVQAYNKSKIEMPVERFNKGIGNILKLGVNLFFLISSGEEIFTRFDQRLQAEDALLFNLTQDSIIFQHAVMEMMSQGFEPNWHQVYEGRGLKRLSLPGYVFDRKIYVLHTNKFKNQALPEVAASAATAVQVQEQFELGDLQERLVELLKGVYVGDGFTLTDSILNINLDSVQIMQFTALMKQEFGVEIPLQVFFQDQSVSEILQQIEEMILPSEGNLNRIERQPDQDTYPVSSAQKRQFVVNQIEPDSLAYNLPGAFKINGDLDRERLEKAFGELIQRHEVLQTSFAIIDGQPVQTIHPEVEFAVSYAECTEAELSNGMRDFVQPFDLSQAPLLRVGLFKCRDDHYLIYDMHHIISDGTSTWILFKEFIQLYAGETLSVQRIQYRDFAVWQNDLLTTEKYQEMENYWLDRFAGEIPVLNLPTDYPRPAIIDYQGADYSINLDQQLLQEINRFTSKKGVTLYMFMLAAYNVLLSKYTGQDDLVVGSPISGRPHADLQNLIGVFINTLAMRNNPADEKTFAEFLSEVKENALAAYENQEYQFEMLVNKLDLERDLSRNPLFDTMFILQNTSRAPITASDLVFSSYEFEKQISQFDLSLIAGEMAGELNLTWEYSTRLFNGETIEQLAHHFIQIIKKVLAEPELKLREIELLSTEEKTRLLEELNQTELEYERVKTLNQLFEEQVERIPDEIALVCGEEQLTYAELNQRANGLARTLQAKGVQSGVVVGLMIERSLEMICGILAVLKSGGAYLPIDPVYPDERVSYMLTDSEAKVLLTQSHLAQRVEFAGETVLVDQSEAFSANGSNLIVTHRATDLANIIYTSGSTGKPKGVIIEHQSVHNFIQGICQRVEFGLGKTIISLTTVSFDIFGLESLLPLAKGMKVVITNEDEQRMPNLLADAILRNGVQFLQATPSRVKLLLEDEQCRKAIKELEGILVGGEAFPQDLLEKLRQTTDARIYNMYGPTETTIWSAMADLTDEDQVHLGQPIANTRLYVLDQNLQPTPSGVRGELYIAGEGLARGYLNRPELTAERFLTDPFRPGKRMYKTGDLVRWNTEGMLEFCGRLDYQVKIRGYRIELGEIENMLVQHPEIRAAVVIDREDETGIKYLCAYLVFKQELSVSELREYLGQELPEYMIPSYFVSLDEIPLNASGKIDRKALPAPDGSVKTGVEYVAPQNDIETRLAKIVSELMGLETVGIDDKFFEIGGDSIKIITFAKRINEEFDCQLKVQDLFKHHTIRKLAEHLNSENPAEQIKEARKFKY